MALLEKHGTAAQTRHPGAPVIRGAVETGDVDSRVRVRPFEDAADRAAKRVAMAADPDRQADLGRSAEAA